MRVIKWWQIFIFVWTIPLNSTNNFQLVTQIMWLRSCHCHFTSVSIFVFNTCLLKTKANTYSKQIYGLQVRVMKFFVHETLFCYNSTTTVQSTAHHILIQDIFSFPESLDMLRTSSDGTQTHKQLLLSSRCDITTVMIHNWITDDHQMSHLQSNKQEVLVKSRI